MIYPQEKCHFFGKGSSAAQEMSVKHLVKLDDEEEEKIINFHKKCIFMAVREEMKCANIFYRITFPIPFASIMRKSPPPHKRFSKSCQYEVLEFK